jgi:hypothetical protein
MSKPFKYTGALAKRSPPKLPLGTWLGLPRFDDRAQAAALHQEEELLDVLFASCGVKRKDARAWEMLARKLAARHVPAFQDGTIARRGRPPEHADEEEVTRGMHGLVTEGKSVRSAAQIVATRRKKGETSEAIEAVYRRTLKEWKWSHEDVMSWRRR